MSNDDNTGIIEEGNEKISHVAFRLKKTMYPIPFVITGNRVFILWLIPTITQSFKNPFALMFFFTEMVFGTVFFFVFQFV